MHMGKKFDPASQEANVSLITPVVTEEESFITIERSYYQEIT